MVDNDLISRQDILGGRLSTDRRANRLLGTIEARVAHMRTETRQAVYALFNGTETEFTRTFGDDYLRSLKMSAGFAAAPVLADIERFAPRGLSLFPTTRTCGRP
jgi:hypothetical protein